MFSSVVSLYSNSFAMSSDDFLFYRHETIIRDERSISPICARSRTRLSYIAHPGPFRPMTENANERDRE